MLRFIAPVAALALITAQAYASGECATSSMSQSQVQALLVTTPNVYACANSYGETWNETLAGGLTGTVTDYKLGSDPIDPTKQVGTYAINSDGTIHYDYFGPTFDYKVTPVPPLTAGTYGNYYFCNGSTTYIVTVQNTGHCY